jgi:hypothetical protein
VDNPIYEPKKKEEEAHENLVDDSDPGAGPIEVDGLSNDIPGSDIDVRLSSVSKYLNYT